jgi:hypothetical protein
MEHYMLRAAKFVKKSIARESRVASVAFFDQARARNSNEEVLMTWD